ncbi:unnamed protein product [Rotaria sordida]|uniref:F-box domain-containing protein n=1 Tax=Rotaria sordida TaxID=392033 RepID=A0A815LFK2_9BILA|nr:unnamed protein product [Rotaria sordida]
MYQIKRQSSFSESLSVQNKKLRTFSEDNISITCIENLSNELFYEIFEYLDGYDIYKAFCNLNSRFQYLTTFSSISLNIKLCSNARSEVKHWCKTVIIPNIHRILSLNLENESLINDFFQTFELMSILYHTPQLRYLICDNLVESDSNVQIEQSITLSNLVYIHINVCHIDFDEFEMFMKVSSQLQVLVVAQEYGKAYLDADRWKRLIIEQMPHLLRFNYQYSEYDYNFYKDTSLDVIINRFSSPFWVDRGWIFELEINIYIPGVPKVLQHFVFCIYLGIGK